MKITLVICLALIMGLAYSEETDETKFETEGGVYVLTEDNFDDFAKGFEHSLVMFYAPWCGHCKKLHPEFEKAAKQLIEKESAIVLAKVDATEEKLLATRFEV